MSAKITDSQFQKAQDKVDSLTRKTRRGTTGTDEERALYKAIVRDWEAANAMPYLKKIDMDRRDQRLLEVAITYGLLL